MRSRLIVAALTVTVVACGGSEGVTPTLRAAEPAVVDVPIPTPSAAASASSSAPDVLLSVLASDSGATSGVLSSSDLQVGGTGSVGPSTGAGGLAGLSSGGVGATNRGPVPGPRSEVSVTSSVSGGAVSNGAAVVAGMRAGFRRCHNNLLMRDPNAAGTLALELKVASDGTVAATSITRSSPAIGELGACVKARAANAAFAPPQGPGNAAATATIAIGISFLTDP